MKLEKLFVIKEDFPNPAGQAPAGDNMKWADLSREYAKAAKAFDAAVKSDRLPPPQGWSFVVHDEGAIEAVPPKGGKSSEPYFFFNQKPELGWLPGETPDAHWMLQNIGLDAE